MNTAYFRARRGCVLLTLAAGFLLSPAQVAQAQSDADMLAARGAYLAGDKAFSEGRYADAVRLFTEGYELSRRPRFLLNIAHAQRLDGQLQEAANTYRQFLESDPRPADREMAESALAEIEAQLGSVKPPPPEPVAPRPPAVEPEVPTSSAADKRERDVPMLLSRQETRAGDDSSDKTWILWAGVGVAVAAAIVLVVVLSGGDDAPPFQTTGTWGRADL